MRILDRYLLREFLAYLAMGVVAFLGIFVVVDVFEKIDKFVDNKTPLTTILRFYLYYLPFVLQQILPVAMLLASLMALGRFARQHELTAMLMAGVSLRRAFAAVFALALAVSALASWFEQSIIPEANYRREEIYNVEIRGRPPARESRLRNIRYIGAGGRIYLINSFDPKQNLMRGVVIQEFLGSSLRRRLDASTATWQLGAWQLNRVTERLFDGDALTTGYHAQLLLSAAETPEDFAKETRKPDQMGFGELRRWIRRLKLSGSDATQYVVDMHAKVAFPLINFITVLVGASLSTRVRRGGMALGFGLSLAISFLYYCALRAGQALGHGGALPPVVAAWSANLVFAGIGLWLFRRAERGR